MATRAIRIPVLVTVLIVVSALVPLPASAASPPGPAAGLPALVAHMEGAAELPDSLTVSVPYRLAVNPVTSWDAEDTLLTMSMDRSSLTPKVRMVLAGPDGDRTLSLPGIVDVDGDLDGRWTARIKDGGQTRITVTGDFLGKAPHLRIKGTAAGEPLDLRMDGLARIRYDVDGNADAVDIRQPLSDLMAPAKETLPSHRGLRESILRLVPGDGDALSIDVLGAVGSLDAARIDGDPMAGGMSVIGTDGAVLLHMVIDPPTSARPALGIRLTGGALDALTEAVRPAGASAESVTISVYAGGIPLAPLLVEWETAKGTLDGVQLVDPAGGGVLFEAALPGDGFAHASIPAALDTLRIGTGTGPVGLVAAATAVGPSIDLTHGGAQALKVRVALASPPRVDIQAGPGLAEAAPLLNNAPTPVLPPVTIIPDDVFGTITALVGNPIDPSEIIVSALDGTPLFAILDSARPALPEAPSPDSDGLVAFVGGYAGTFPEDAIRVTGDPFTPGGFGVDVGEHVSMRMEPKALAGSPVGLATLNVAVRGVDGIADGTVIVVDPMAILYDPSGAVAGVTVPEAPGADPVGLIRTGDGVTFHTPLGDVQLANGIIVIDGGPDDAMFVATVLRDGAAIASFSADRTTKPPVLSFTGGGQTVTFAGPVTLKGRVADPDAITVVDPQTGEVLLDYARTGDRATLDFLGHEETLHVRAITIEGDPLGPSDWDIVFRDPTGARVHTVEVKNGLSSKAAQPGREMTGTFFAAAVDSDSAGRLISLHSTAGNGVTHAAAALDGTGWISPMAPITLALAAASDDADMARILLHHASGRAATTDDPAVAFAKRSDGRWYATLSSEVLRSMPLDRNLNLLIAYEKSVSPLAKLVDVEPGRGDSYRVRFDVTGPVVAIQPEAAIVDDFRIPLVLAGSDKESGLHRYEIQWRDGAADWQQILTEEQSLTFSGKRGAEYGFRARGMDRAGNTGAWSEIANVRTLKSDVLGDPGSDSGEGRDPGSDDVNDPPTVRFTSPEPGTPLEGIVLVSWEATDPDGTMPTTSLFVSRDDGRTWDLLYAGSGNAYAWNTGLEEHAGNLRLKIVASDGTLQDLDILTNLKAPAPAVPKDGTAPGGSGTRGGNGGDGGDGGTGPDGTPGTGAGASGEPLDGSAAGAAGGGSGDDGGGGFLGLPGFEMGLAVVALAGMALARRKRA